MKSNYTPTTHPERIALLDILRGFAIFGILMVNLPMMYLGCSSTMIDPVDASTLLSTGASTLDLICKTFVSFFFEGKFYIIFSLLFGYGFWLFMSKKTETGKSIIPVFRRRLFFLLLFGAAHVAFLWPGDVLVYYALFGFILILFRKSSNKKIFGWAIFFVSIPIVFTFISVLMISMTAYIPEAQAQMELGMELSMAQMSETVNNILGIYSTGSYSEILNARLEEYNLTFIPVLFFAYPTSMAMFLIGVLIAKKGYIAKSAENLPIIKKTFWWGLGIGIIASAIYTVIKPSVNQANPTWDSLLMTIMYITGGIALAFTYGSGIIQLYAKRKERYIFGLLSSTGRMALSNYLAQSIIVAFLIYPFGLGLFGKIQIWESIILAVSLFTIQMFISRWWLTKFYFGPFEWLWRSLTYWKIQPFLRK